MRAKFIVFASIILIGFTAAIAQILILREMLVVFHGNEMSIGLILASWLLWTALGSRLMGRFTEGRNHARTMASIQALLALVLPATILAVRGAKSLLQTVPGEVLGPGMVLLTSLGILSLFCILSGGLFPAGSKLYAAEAGSPTGQATGSVYWCEAAGSAAGGILAALILIQHLSSLETALLLALLNLLAASLLLFRVLWPCAVMAGAAIWIAFLGWPSILERMSQESLWRGFHLLATRNSVYGSLAVIGTEGSRTVYENGVVLLNVPDPAAAEEAVHYALLEHPAPRRLLLIGGGLNGSITQALQHATLQAIDYVELDPAILAIAQDYFPREWRAIRNDPRVHLHVTDGRLFLKETQTQFDVIIVNLPDPQTAQLNRFYTVEFFEEANRRLAPTGLLSFHLTASEDYISPNLAEFLQSIHKSLRAVFPQIAVLPGPVVHFFAARQPGVLASGSDELLARLRARNLHTEYVREYYVPFRMMPDRVAELESQIKPSAATPLNRDFEPIAYYFDVALWSGQFKQTYRQLFRALAGIDFTALAAGTALVLFGLCWKCRSVPLAAAASTAATGFVMMGLEVLLLLGFQAIYGYVYQQLAILIAAFMAGLAFGTWAGLRSPGQRDLHALVRLLTAVAVAPLLLCAVFQLLTRGRGAPMMFPALALFAGILGGYEFPIASRIFFSSREMASSGTLYALDLAGSCAGALLFSIYLVPVFGFFRTAVLSAIVSLTPAVMVLAAIWRRDPRARVPELARGVRRPVR